MSSRISGIAWDADLPRAEKFILLAMADHADHEGENVRPSVALIVRKTGYGRTHVLATQERLRERGILEVVAMRATEGRPTLYRILVENIPTLPAWRSKKPGRPTKPGSLSEPPFDENLVHSVNHPGSLSEPQNQLLELTTEKETPLPPAGAGGSVEGADENPLPTPPRTPDPKKAAEAAAVEEVLEDWRQVVGSRRQFKPADASWKKVREALRYGFTRTQLRLAALGAFNTPWNRGENPQGKKYLNPETIFRNSEKIDTHMNTARTKLPAESWWPKLDGDDIPAPVQQRAAGMYTGNEIDLMNLAEAIQAGRSAEVEKLKKRLGFEGQTLTLASGAVG
jgi:hypothetical protein